MFITRHWRLRKPFIFLLTLEWPMTVAILTLTAIAHPDTYRQALWQDGSDNGFNSSPTQILYSYANHDHNKLKVPMVWSQLITDFNFVLAILTLFILVAKSTMFVMGTLIPIASVVTHVIELILYAVSVYGQSGPDTSDPKHLQKGAPWYLTKSCSVVHTQSNYHYCEQAKATFAVTVLLLSMYAIDLLISIYACIPTKAEKLARLSSSSSDIPMYEPESINKKGSVVCLAPMNPVAVKNNPYTPRTVAFQTLQGGGGGGGGGNGGYHQGTSVTAKGLPFRERYGGDEEYY